MAGGQLQGDDRLGGRLRAVGLAGDQHDDPARPATPSTVEDATFRTQPALPVLEADERARGWVAAAHVKGAMESVVAHPLFVRAESSRDLARFWLSQEVHVVNGVAQECLRLAGGLPNVHLRSMLLEIGSGLHGELHVDRAFGGRTLVLENLAGSVGLVTEAVSPVAAVDRHMTDLAAASTTPAGAVGALLVVLQHGPRHELAQIARLLGVEAPRWVPSPLESAKDHYRGLLLDEVAARLLTARPDDLGLFLAGVAQAVESRYRYLDRLLYHFELIGLPGSWVRPVLHLVPAGDQP